MTDLTASAAPARLPLQPGQAVTLALYGAVLWFLAALLLRVLGPMGVYEGPALVVLYALIVPGTFPFVLLAERLAGLARTQIALGYAVATTAAMLLDGMALAWAPGLYGMEADHVAQAGATILWGAGVGLVLAFLRNRTGQP